jgi:hypothetical protein
MQHGNVVTKLRADREFPGIRVYKDKFDRWAGSRTTWNQHAYSITNVGDDGKVPKTSQWPPNFRDPKLDNFRASRQGATSSDLADLKALLDPLDACHAGGFTGVLCNAGLRDVAAGVPATFYATAPDGGVPIPVCGPVYTSVPVRARSCIGIVCAAPPAPPPFGLVLTVNSVSGGNPTPSRAVDECNYQNDTAVASITSCR